MNAVARNSTTLRLACVGFAAEELAALRRLLGLLASHLPRQCVLVDAGAADLVMVNLDVAADLPGPRGAAVVGCSTKPKEHPSGTLYRPIRAYQLLALLSRNALRQPVAESAGAGDDERGTSRYRLRLWPAQAVGWSHEWWMVMATIRRAHHGVDDIADRTGVARDTVRRCIAELERLQALDREQLQDRHAPAAVPVARDAGWRTLAARVGRVLGFAR